MASVEEEVPTHVDPLANAKRTADWITAMAKHQKERLEEERPASAHTFKQLVVLQVAISKFAAANACALASCAEAVEAAEKPSLQVKRSEGMNRANATAVLIASLDLRNALVACDAAASTVLNMVLPTNNTHAAHFHSDAWVLVLLCIAHTN